VTKKSDQVQKLLKKIAPRYRLPKPLEQGTLLEQGLLVVLVRSMPQERAEAAIATLKKAYPDWNEMRVAQAQEIAAALLPKGRRENRDAIAAMLPAARAARDFIQEVFQKTHGLELEFLREDLAASGKLVQQMPLLGLAGGSYLLWLAGDRQMPVHGALVRVLDRLGLIARTASMKKARDVIDPLVTSGEELAFVTAFGEIADRWCDARKPLCHECVLVEECVFGKKAFVEWKQLQTRLEGQRVKEEARRVLAEKKDQARRVREDARNAKKAALASEKQERERQRREAQLAKEKSRQTAEQARAIAQQKKVAAAEKEKARAVESRKKVVVPARKDAKSRPAARPKAAVRPLVRNNRKPRAVPRAKGR
jgi:endonuclease III